LFISTQLVMYLRARLLAPMDISTMRGSESKDFVISIKPRRPLIVAPSVNKIEKSQAFDR